jgi:Big-like domain-containing protein
VSRWGVLLVMLGLQGCSGLTEGAGGLVELRIVTPTSSSIEIGQSIQLAVQALDKDGNPVNTPVTWQAPDPTLTVDPNTGVITGISTGVGRVQATSGSLSSSLLQFNVTAAADTLVIPGDSVFTVPAGVTNTAPLVVQLRTFTPDAGLPSKPVIYTVTSPPDVGPHTVELPGGVLADTVLTGTDGAVSGVTLIRVNGTTQPDTAIVEVRAVRASGAAVPGSGQRFIVLFQ